MKFTHEYDDEGRHRLVAILGHQVVATGEWAWYIAPCLLKQEGTPNQWFCVTAYWDGTFTPNAVYSYFGHQEAEPTDV